MIRINKIKCIFDRKLKYALCKSAIGKQGKIYKTDLNCHFEEGKSQSITSEE